ncbi:MAG TPA: LysR family transcriptional regulator [Desulfobulbus sp.]|nr:LysR family transcriptional regulator [Desulfobulbus sp.]
MSEQIRSLERRLECRLFDRLGRSIKPTRHAEILFPKAMAILEDIRRLEQELLVEADNVSGELILGASTIPGAYILPRIATNFKADHSQISFEIRIADSGEVIDSVLNHDLLIGIVGTRISSTSLNFFPFVEDELVLAASARRELPSSVSLQQLAELPFLLREQGSGTRKTLEEYGLKNGFGLDQLNVVAVLGSNAAVKEAIKEDLGVSILSSISIRDELRCGRLQKIRIQGMTLKRSFYITTLKKRTLPNLYTVFLETLCSQRSSRTA